jgi:hypothetical protein
VHDGLIDHRNQVRKLHSTVRMADVGLRDHKSHLTNLLHDNAHAHQRMREHDSRIKKLSANVTSLRSESRNVEQIQQDVKAMQNAHDTRISAHNNVINYIKTELCPLRKLTNSSTPKLDRVDDAVSLKKSLAGLQEQFENMKTETRTVNRKTCSMLEEVHVEPKATGTMRSWILPVAATPSHRMLHLGIGATGRCWGAVVGAPELLRQGEVRAVSVLRVPRIDAPNGAGARRGPW